MMESQTAQPSFSLNGDKKQEALRIANERFRQAPDWITFFREVLGVDGVARCLFGEGPEMTGFEQSEEFNHIQQMVAKLREKGSEQDGDKEPTRVITVRLPKCLHESLRAEAHSRQTSMNQLCISKLLQVIEDSMVPSESKGDERTPEATANRMSFQPSSS